VLQENPQDIFMPAWNRIIRLVRGQQIPKIRYWLCFTSNVYSLGIKQKTGSEAALRKHLVHRFKN
jgi:hypothetical protein